MNFLPITALVLVLVVCALLAAAASGKPGPPNLRRLEAKLDALLKFHGITLPSGLSPEVQWLAANPSQKIAAIKLHREQTGCSLAEAKEDVETFQAGSPLASR